MQPPTHPRTRPPEPGDGGGTQERIVEAERATTVEGGGCRSMARDDVPSVRPLIDKLGVKEGARVAVIGLDDPEFVTLLRSRTADVFLGRRRVGLDQLFVRFDRREDLARL